MRHLAVMSCLLLLAACAATPTAHQAEARPLLPPASLGERAASQVVRAAIGPRDLTFNCVITIQDGVMTVVGLNATGVRLFTVSHDGREVKSETSPGVPRQFDPEHLLADLQLVYAPLPLLQSHLKAQGWQLSEPVPGTRRLRRGERLVAEVHFSAEDPWTSRSWLVNFAPDYSLQIDSQTM